MWSWGTAESSVSTCLAGDSRPGLAGESSVKCGRSVSEADMESSSNTFSMACHTWNKENGVSLGVRW